MPVDVKDAASSARKFVQRAQAAASDYAAGVRGSGQKWAAAAAAGADNYNAGVQAAITRNAFQRGVQEAGPQRYEAKATTLGAQRFGPGVAQAEGDWATATAPFLDTIRNLTLPVRRPKGDPSNYQRNQAVGEALRRRKMGS